MGATTVTGTILGVDNAPQVGVYVTFRLKSVGTDSAATSTIDQDSISSPATDSNGDFSVTLWDNGDSGIESILEIRMPSGQRIDVIIPAGDAAIDIWDLIENFAVGTADPQLPTNEALFMKKASNLSDVSSASISRTNLGVAIGSDVQAHSTVLDNTTASFLTADETKLDGIEPLATIDQTGAEIKTAYESEADTNAFTDADETKLDGVEALAEVNDLTTVLDADIGVTVQAHDSVLDGTTASFTTAAETKLDGITAGGEPNDPTTLLDADIGVTVQAHSTNLDSVDQDLATTDDVTFANITVGGDIIAGSAGLDIKNGVGSVAMTIGASNSKDLDVQGVLTLGTDLAITEGGTGASTASAARTALGVAIGSDAQAHDDDLDDIAALSPSEHDVIVRGASEWEAKDGQIADNIVAIRSASDFPTTLVDGTQYNVHGSFDMGAVSPIIPAAGSRITICGIGPGSSLTSSENNYVMFVDVTNSGSIQFDDLRLSVTGTNSKLFDLTNDGTGAFVLEQVTIFNCTNIGDLTGYAFISAFRSQDTGCTDGWTFDGNISVLDFTQYGSFGMASGGITFSAGGSLLITSRAFIQGNMTMPTGSIFSDITAAEIDQDAGLQVFECEFEGDGVFFSNIDEKNIKSNWRGNTFPSIPPDNTHVGGGWLIASGGDEVINSTTPTVYLKVNGTTTPSDLQWFSGGTANDLELDSTRAVSITISGTIYFEGTNNATIQVKLVADDGTPVDIRELGEAEFVGTNAPLNYSFADIPFVITSANTVIEVHAKSSSGSFTAKVHSYIQISARS